MQLNSISVLIYLSFIWTEHDSLAMRYIQSLEGNSFLSIHCDFTWYSKHGLLDDFGSTHLGSLTVLKNLH